MTSIEIKVAEAQADLNERLDLLGRTAIRIRNERDQLLRALKALLMTADDMGFEDHPDVVVTRGLIAKVEGA